ncbi:hypothetical protein [Polluticoccus soli]|uniref:hypothetical protein n=1 Tax=Polluticoccus soli TaxID=3034150 RepID=UPI0023E26C82|nr:hypothetical protein [Flavipsychrobacter sp. JY13-12]
MAYTFFYTTETEHGPAAIKFEAKTPKITEFEVTVLNHDVQPFKLELMEDEWIPVQLPEKLKPLEDEIKEMARKFRR